MQGRTKSEKTSGVTLFSKAGMNRPDYGTQHTIKCNLFSLSVSTKNLIFIDFNCTFNSYTVTGYGWQQNISRYWLWVMKTS